MKTYNEYEKIAERLHKTSLFVSFPGVREACEDGAKAVRELAKHFLTATEIQSAGQRKDAGREQKIDDLKGHWLADFICPVCGEHSRKPREECPFCHTIMIETEDQTRG